jgi:alpha-beta hydrolase superfamily lysophospholipase
MLMLWPLALLAYTLRADERRRLALMRIPPREVPADVDLVVGWHLNKRGMLLAHKQYLPRDRPVRGCIGMVHGYGDHSQDLHMDVPLRLCQDGFAVFSMDIEGHGLSDGLHGDLPSVRMAVADLAEYFVEMVDKYRLRDKSLFLYGHSMGGAVVFNLCTLPQYAELQGLVKGVILCAPMVKIADELRPGPLVIALLRLLAGWLPLAPITPIKEINADLYKRPEVLARSRICTLAYDKKPRVATAVEMLTTTEDVAARMAQLVHPVLILHGGADVVTCHKLSQTLFEQCSSEDKTIKVYPDCWHDILNGESEEQIGFIYADLCSWMKKRC